MRHPIDSGTSDPGPGGCGPEDNGAPRPAAFAADTRASISIIGTLVIAGLAVLAAFVIGSAQLYSAKLGTQRVADLAVVAAANTTSPIVGGIASPTAQATALNVATINGLGGASVTTTAGAAPSGDGNQALTTTIVQQASLGLDGLLGLAKALPVRSTSTVEIATTPSGTCVQALLTSVIMLNAASLQGTSCQVTAALSLQICNTATLNVAKVVLGIPRLLESLQLCTSGVVKPSPSIFTYSGTSSDTVASNADIVAIKSHLATMGVGWPYGSPTPVAALNPSVTMGLNRSYSTAVAVLPEATPYGSLTVSGSTLTFGGNTTADPDCQSPTTVSGNVSFSGINTLNFATGCYVFAGTVSSSSGSTTTFAIVPGAQVTMVFKGLVQNAGTSMTLGSASYYFNGGIGNTASGTLTVGSGQMVIGVGIDNTSTGTLQFGNGPFYLNLATINNASSGTLTLGSGPFYLGGGGIINVAGTLTLGDGPLYVDLGSLVFGTGSSTSFGMGDIDLYGGSIVANGKAFTLGSDGSAAGGSGTLSLYGGSIQMLSQTFSAVGETIALSAGGVGLLGSGAVDVRAPTAPTSSQGHGHTNVAFVLLFGPFTLGQWSSASDTVAGLVYAPLNLASIIGNETVAPPSGGCLMVVAGAVSLLNNVTVDASPCSNLATTGSTGSTRLVQ